jgi:predicted GNAT family N-acyltransferase
MRSFRSIEELGDPKRIAQSVTDEQDLQAIYRLRYKAYVEQQGKSYPWANHDLKSLRDPDDATARRQFVLRDSNAQIVAAVRTHEYPPIHLSDRLATESFTEWADYPLYYVSKLVVSKEARDASLVRDLIIACFRDGASLGSAFSIIHASPRLLSMYRRIGFRPYFRSFLDSYAGLQVPLVYVGVPWAGASGPDDELRPLHWFEEQLQLGIFSAHALVEA